MVTAVELKKNNESFSLNKFEYLFPFVIIALFYMHNVTSSSIAGYIGMACLLITVVIYNTRHLLIITALLTPNLMMLKLVTSGSSLMSIFVIAIFIKYIFENKSFKCKLCLLLHVTFVLITITIYLDTSLITAFIRSMSFLLMAMDIVFLKEEERGKYINSSVLRAYFFGTVLSVLIGIIYYSQMGLNLFSGYFAGIRNDRNYFSATFALCICIGLFLMNLEKANMVYYGVGSMILLFGGLVSSSRTFMLSLIFVFGFYVLLPVSSKKVKIGILLVFVAIGAFCLFGNQFIRAYDRMLKRFQLDTMSDGSGRLPVWEYYLRKTVSSPIRFLFGNGSAMQYIEMGEVKLIEHNTIIQLFSTTGLLGSLTWISSIAQIGKKLSVPCRIRIATLSIIPLLSVIFSFFMISSLYLFQFDFALFIALVFMYSIRQEWSMIDSIRQSN